ncbi:MAG: SUMF1/EgtB/PvdO family nonheme iron enzyme [Myxococcota bacterium]
MLRPSPSPFAIFIGATAAFALACGDSTTAPLDGSVPDASIDAAEDERVELDSGVPTDMAPEAAVDAAMDMSEVDMAEADMAEACGEEGAVRPADCGNCGEGQETCTGGVWVLSDLCLNQGECAPGTSERRNTPMCGEEARICNVECTWGDFGEVTPDGECLPGETRRATEGCDADEFAIETCSADCEFGEPFCEPQCPDLDTDGLDEEVCIPAGPFMRGATDPDPRYLRYPLVEVQMSAFAIDRYPVTVGRYAECVDAGACTEPEMADGRAVLADPLVQNSAILQLTWNQATAFCGWVGRELPTYAMFVKVARGPAPNTDSFPWGNDFDCDEVPTLCGGSDWVFEDVGVDPRRRAWYPVDTFINRAPAFVSDWHDDMGVYHRSPESRVDPTGPEGPGELRVVVAHGPNNDVARSPGVTTPDRYNSDYQGGAMFRCARSFGGER